MRELRARHQTPSGRLSPCAAACCRRGHEHCSWHGRWRRGSAAAVCCCPSTPSSARCAPQCGQRFVLESDYTEKCVSPHRCDVQKVLLAYGVYLIHPRLVPSRTRSSAFREYDTNSERHIVQTMVNAREQHSHEYVMMLTALTPPRRVISAMVHRVADRLDARRRYMLDAASVDAATAMAHDFAENGSIINRHQMVMQSDYWAPIVLCRQMSCACVACSTSSNSATVPVFSECSGENGVEEAL